MTNRILFRAYANENTISVQTYTPRMRSPQWFYITYSELDRLQDEGSLITSDIHSFAKLRLDERRDRITFEFTWLSGCGFDRVEGVEQTVHLRWGKFRDFLDVVRQPDCPKENKVFRAVSLDARRGRPRLVFDGNRANLRAAIGDPRVRHKLGKALMDIDELAVLDGGKCILQLRGVRPFLSSKYDITRHPNYKYLADFDKKNTFDIERFLSTQLKPKPSEVYDVFEVDVSEEDIADDPDGEAE